MKIRVKEYHPLGTCIEVDDSFLPTHEYESFINSNLGKIKPHIYEHFRREWWRDPEDAMLWVFSDYSKWGVNWWSADWRGIKIGTNHGYPNLLHLQEFKDLLVDQWLKSAYEDLASALEDILIPIDNYPTYDV